MCGCSPIRVCSSCEGDFRLDWRVEWRRDSSEDRDDRERAAFDQFDAALDASLYPGTGRNR